MWHIHVDIRHCRCLRRRSCCLRKRGHFLHTTHLMAFQRHVYQHTMFIQRPCICMLYTNVHPCAMVSMKHGHIYQFSFIFSVCVRFFLLHCSTWYFVYQASIWIIASVHCKNKNWICLQENIIHKTNVLYPRITMIIWKTGCHNNTQYNKIVADFPNGLAWKCVVPCYLYIYLFIEWVQRF